MLIYCAVAVVTTTRNKVLVLRRQKGRDVGLYECPGGHVDDGEDAVTGVLRELQEEAGLKDIPRDKCQMFFTMYDPCEDGVTKSVVSCFHIKLGSVVPDVTLEHMFDDYQWYDLINPNPDVVLTKECQILIDRFKQIVMLEDITITK